MIQNLPDASIESGKSENTQGGFMTKIPRVGEHPIPSTMWMISFLRARRQITEINFLIFQIKHPKQ